MNPCADCGAPDAPNAIGGRRRCNGCAVKALAAVTVDRDASPGLAYEVPRARQSQRYDAARQNVRHRARRSADTAAARRLKLMHLTDYQALYTEELHRREQPAPKVRPLDIYLRQLASRRLLALVQRMDSDA